MLGFSLTAIVLMTLAVGGGLLVFDPPRNFIFWISIGLIFSLVYVCAVAGENLAVSFSLKLKPSGATIAIMSGIIFLSILSFILCTAVYSALTVSSNEVDIAFAVAMVVMSFILLTVTASINVRDLCLQETERPAMETRAKHVDLGKSLMRGLSFARHAKIIDDGNLKALAVLIKRLESIQVALAHSHGGGIGSWEIGRLHPQYSEQDEQTLQENVAKIVQLLESIAKGGSDESGAMIKELENTVDVVSNKIEALEIS